MALPSYYPILNSYRSGYIDNRYYAIVSLYDKNGLILKKGETNNSLFFLRSLFKPIQASILDDNIIKHFNFLNEELAIMQGSHSGEPVHIELVQSILNKIGLSEKDLKCPIIPPLNTKVWKNFTKYSKLHNNCSAKHSMMLAYCVYKGLDINNYLDFSHPMQIKIKEKLLNYAKTNNCKESSDGCLAPIYALSLDDISKAFLNYYEDKNNETLINAYKSNPYIIGGVDDYAKRSDTEIMEKSDNLISKVGAGGFIYIYNTDKKQILIIKMAQNNNFERRILSSEILYKLKWINEKFADTNLYLEDNSKIGEYIVDWD